MGVDLSHFVGLFVATLVSYELHTLGEIPGLQL